MFKDPILLLTFKRPIETKKVLKKILSINPKKLYVFQDGISSNFNSEDLKLYNKTTKIIQKKRIKRKFVYHKFKNNIGQRYIASKTLKVVFKKESRIIFLEDDTVPDITFFKFCSLMLKKFENNRKIFHISGCNHYYGTQKKIIGSKSYFFTKYPQFWGWATWKKKWNKFYNPDIKDWNKNRNKFLKVIFRNEEARFFDFYITKNAKKIHIGWDIPWIYKLILNKKLTVMSSVNLIRNIGFKNNPSGKGARKFRNLYTGRLKFPLKNNNNYIIDKTYDNYLFKSFYQRKIIPLRIYYKLLYKIKKFL